MLDLNVLGLAVACREALKHFPESGGHVVNLGSMSGHRVPGRGGFYSATKFAVRALTEGLRQELRAAGNNTRVSSVSPGFVDTSCSELLDLYFAPGTGGVTKYDAIQLRNPQAGRSRCGRDPAADDAGVRRDHRCPDAPDGSGGVAKDAKSSGWKDAHSGDCARIRELSPPVFVLNRTFWPKSPVFRRNWLTANKKHRKSDFHL